MELLRRTLLVGCLLPGLWLMRLAPLDPLISLAPIDFAEQQAREAAAVPDDRRTEAQRRSAAVPLPVYIEEFLQYNVFPASGAAWDRLLGQIDDAAQGRDVPRHLSRRFSDRPTEPGAPRYAFFRMDDAPMGELLDQLAAGHGTTYVSISRPGGDHHYRVERRIWTNQDFHVGAGFTGAPAPPPSLLYPFRWTGAALAAIGCLLFTLLPGRKRAGAWLGLSIFEALACGAAAVLFLVPLMLVGGSVQALTRGLLVALPCWAAAVIAVHLFAGPARNAPNPPAAAWGSAAPDSHGPRHARMLIFIREGLAFLAMALGPVTFLITMSMVLWNR